MPTPDPAAAPTRAAQSLLFRDPRPPQVVQWALERDLMALFTERVGAPRYTLESVVPYGRQRFTLQLVFEAALPHANRYSLHVELLDSGPDPEPAPRVAERLASWMSHWTRHFAAEAPPPPATATAGDDTDAAARYADRVERARVAEAHLADVPALQQEIVQRMRAGAVARRVHKEGSTTFAFRAGQWRRVDGGDLRGAETFRSDAAFFDGLRRSFDGELRRNVAPDALPELVAWRLLLRLLEEDDHFTPPASNRGVVAWALLLVTATTLALGKLRIAWHGRDSVPLIDRLFYPSLVVVAVCLVVGALWLRRHWNSA